MLSLLKYIVDSDPCTSTIQRGNNVAFPWQQWTRERAIILNFKFTAYLVFCIVLARSLCVFTDNKQKPNMAAINESVRYVVLECPLMPQNVHSIPADSSTVQYAFLLCQV